jgi:hypothetical protein
MSPRLLEGLGWVFAAVLALSPVGCDKLKGGGDDDETKAEKDDDAKKKKEEAPPATASATATSLGLAPPTTPTPVAPPVPSGPALTSYMPADCSNGRIYLNVDGVLGEPNARALWNDLVNQVMGGASTPEAQKIRQSLQDGGFDAKTAFKEAAMCMGATDDRHVMGIKLGVADPIGLFVKLIEATGGQPPKVEQINQLKMIRKEKQAFAQPAPGILLFGQAGPVAAAKDGTGTAGFGPAQGAVFFAQIATPKGETIEAKVTDAGASYALSGSFVLAGAEAQKLQSNPDQFLAGLKQELQKGAAEMQGTPFKLVGDRMQQVNLTAQGNKVVATLTMPKTDIAELIRAAAASNGITLNAAGAPPPPGQPQPPVSGNRKDPLVDLVDVLKTIDKNKK